MLVLSVWSEVQTVCIWSSWCHWFSKTPSPLASFKSRLVLPFLYRLTQAVLEKRSLNGYSSSSSNISSSPSCPPMLKWCNCNCFFVNKSNYKFSIFLLYLPCFNGYFPNEHGLSSPPSFPLHLFQKKTFGDKQRTGFYGVDTLLCHPINTKYWTKLSTGLWWPDIIY